jgi:hypothetical protein
MHEALLDASSAGRDELSSVMLFLFKYGNITLIRQRKRESMLV